MKVCYKNVTEILKKYYKYAKRIEKQILKGYNNFATKVVALKHTAIGRSTIGARKLTQKGYIPFCVSFCMLTILFLHQKYS